MANSSSDESSTAPRDFHISSSLDSGSYRSRMSSSRQRCSLCHSFRKNFYCRDCVLSGLFYHSKFQVTESFHDKHKTLLELEDGKRTLEKKCIKHVDTRQKADILRTKIRQIRDRNRTLKLAVEDKRQKRHRMMGSLAELKEKIDKYLKNLPKYEQKVMEMESYAATKRDKVTRLHVQIRGNQEQTKRLIKIRIDQIQCVFPIAKVLPKLEMESEEGPHDMIAALAEASQTTYIRDRWEYTDHSGELQFSVVEPTLPGSGNYSLYNIWVSQNKDAVPTNTHPDLIEHNPAFNIGAALTYTAQLIQVLAFYFNVRLPYRMVYSDFCGSYMSEPQFTRRVARINANVLYLCFSQNINLATLRASETIHNILQLIDTNNRDVGSFRKGSPSLNSHKAALLEHNLTKDLNLSNDTDSDDGDSFHVEWEAVPHIQCPEVPAGAVIVQSNNSQMISTQQATSITGGLYNSIASIVRGFTGR